MKKVVSAIALSLLFIMTSISAKTPTSYLVYVGTFSDQGIFRFHLDSESGELREAGPPTEIKRPDFLAIHPNNKFLYTVYDKSEKGAASFKILNDGSLELLNHGYCGGINPCHITTDSTGKHVLIANYSSGSVSSLPIRENGSLKKAVSIFEHQGSSINPKRQTKAHAHSINLSPDNKFAFAADLGTDRIHKYRFNTDTGQLSPIPSEDIAITPGSGPRHFSFHPKGTYAYLISELSSTITAFSYQQESGKLNEIQTISTLPENSTINNSTAEICVHPNGRFLYGSNRGHNSIACYTINEENGKLTLIGHTDSGGEIPRNFSITPNGKFLLLANQKSNNIVVFKFDPETGKAIPTPHSVNAEKPVCIRMIPLN